MTKHIFEDIEPIYSHVHFVEACRKSAMSIENGQLLVDAEAIARAYIDEIGYRPALDAVVKFAREADSIIAGSPCKDALANVLRYIGMLLNDHFFYALNGSIDFPDMIDPAVRESVESQAHFPIGTRMIWAMLPHAARIQHPGIYEGALNQLALITRHFMISDQNASLGILGLRGVRTGTFSHVLRKETPMHQDYGQYMIGALQSALASNMSRADCPCFSFGDYVAHYKGIFTEAHRRTPGGRRFGGYPKVMKSPHPVDRSNAPEGSYAEWIASYAHDILLRAPQTYMAVVCILKNSRITRHLNAAVIDADAVCEGAAGHDDIYTLSGMSVLESDVLHKDAVREMLSCYLMEAVLSVPATEQSAAMAVHYIASVVAYIEAVYYAFAPEEAAMLMDHGDYYTDASDLLHVPSQIAEGLVLSARKTLINLALRGLVHRGNVNDLRQLFTSLPDLDRDVQDVLDLYESSSEDQHGILTGNPWEQSYPRSKPTLQ